MYVFKLDLDRGRGAHADLHRKRGQIYTELKQKHLRLGGFSEIFQTLREI